MARSSSKNSGCSSLAASWRKRSESARTRSTTRPSRVEVERISVPLAEIKTAGVIMAVNTPSDAVRASMLESVAVHSSDFEPARPIRYARLWRAGLRNPESAYDLAQFCLNFNSTQPPSTPEECVPNFMIFSALRIVAENRYHFVDRWRVE